MTPRVMQAERAVPGQQGVEVQLGQCSKAAGVGGDVAVVGVLENDAAAVEQRIASDQPRSCVATNQPGNMIRTMARCGHRLH